MVSGILEYAKIEYGPYTHNCLECRGPIAIKCLSSQLYLFIYLFKYLISEIPISTWTTHFFLWTWLFYDWEYNPYTIIWEENNDYYWADYKILGNYLINQITDQPNTFFNTIDVHCSCIIMLFNSYSLSKPIHSNIILNALV